MSFVVEKLRQTEVKQTCLRPQGQSVKGLHLNLEATALCPVLTHWRASHGHIFTSEGDAEEDKTQRFLGQQKNQVQMASGNNISERNINQHTRKAREHTQGWNHGDYP